MKIHLAHAAAAALILLFPARARAQILDVHGSLAPSIQSNPPAYGFGAALGTTRGFGPVNLLPSVGVDYIRARDLGPGRGSAGLDVRFLPSWEAHWGAPFIGAGASANWSGGVQSEWPGTRLGLDLLGGYVLGGVSSNVGLKFEGRFGYVRGEPHTLTTRFGFVTLL